MAVVVRWKADGDYLSDLAEENGRPVMKWSKSRRDALRFPNRAMALSRIETHFGRPVEVVHHGVKFVRLVSKRRADIAAESRSTSWFRTPPPSKRICRPDGTVTYVRDNSGLRSEMTFAGGWMAKCEGAAALESQPADAAVETEPTARDAVAGMLLRNSWEVTAEKLARSVITPAQAIDRIRLEGEANEDCIAALEALGRGEIRIVAMGDAMGHAHAALVELRRDMRAALGAGEAESSLKAAEHAARERDRLREASAHAPLEKHEHSRGGVYELSTLRREHQTDHPEDSAGWPLRWAQRRDRLSKTIQQYDLSAFARGYVNGCRDTWGSAEVDMLRDSRAPLCPDATAEMRPAEDIAREMVSNARQSDFSMESRATLFGILVVPALQGDVDDLRRHLARLIKRIRAEGLRASGRERVKAWLDNLPPEMAKVYEELKDADPKGRPLSGDAAAQADEPSGMRIEKRADGEWLVGAGAVNDCDEIVMIGDRCWPCFYHMNGEHITTGTLRDGAELIMARWPIASVPERDEPSRIAIPGADDLHMFSVDPASRVDLIVPKALDAQDAMRAVAELLGMPSETDELARVAGQASDIGFASGVEEGERRAKAKVAELISEWDGKRLATLALRRSAEPGTETWARRDSSALIRRSCSLDLSLMFDVEIPPDGSGDDGAEGCERRSLQARLEAERAAVQAELDAGKRVLAVHEKYLATARALATSWDAREQRMVSKANEADARGDGLYAERCRGRGGAAFLCANEIRKAFAIEPTDPGKPQTVEAPKEHAEITHGGVKVTAPVEMSLGEVWGALSSAPALRVCLDSETRRAREDGIVEGLWRADAIVRGVGMKAYDVEEFEHVVIADIRHAISVACPQPTESATEASP